MGSKSLTNAGNSVAARLASVPASAVSAGQVGLVVGGLVSTIHNTYKIGRGEIKSTEAVANVVKDTAGTGLATAVGAAVMTALGIGGLLGLAGFVTVAALTKGAWDSTVCGAKKTV